MEKQQQEALIGNQTVTDALLAMEKRVRLYNVVAALISNRTGAACEGLPPREGWFESDLQAQQAYIAEFPVVAQNDLRGVWQVRVACSGQ